MSNGEVKFDIGDKSKQLMFKVFDATTDKSHYPSKFRQLASKLQEYVLNIHSNVLDANSFRTDSVEHKQKRFDLQTEAITNVNKFLDLTENWNDCDYCNGVRPFWWIARVSKLLLQLKRVRHIIKRVYNLSREIRDKYKGIIWKIFKS